MKICYYPVRTFVLVVLLLVIVIGGRLFYVAKTGNVSNFVKTKITGFLKSKGVDVDFQRLTYSPKYGFRLHNLFWKIAHNQDALFMQAESVTLKSNFWEESDHYQLKAVELSNAILSVYLQGREQPIHIRNINAALNIDAETLRFEDASLVVDPFTVRCKGKLFLPAVSAESTAFSPPLLYKQTFAGIRNYLKQFKELQKAHDTTVQHLLKLTDIVLSVSFNVDVNHLENTAVKVDFTIPSHTVRGVQVREATGSLDYKKGVLQLKNGLIAIDKKEFIRLNASHCINTHKTECAGELKLYPERLSTFLIGYSEKVTSIAGLIKSSGEPVSVNFRIPEQKLLPEKMKVEARVKALDLIYDNELNVKRLSAELNWEAGTLSFKCRNLNFNNNAFGECDGVLLTDNLELLLRGDVTGNPRFAWKFMGKKSQEVYRMICDWFSWRKESPSRIKFLMQTNFDDFYMTSDIEMSNFKFHHKPVKMLNTGLSLDLSDEKHYMLMYNTSIMTGDGNDINGQLSYQFHKEDNEIHFDAVSTEPPGDVFELMGLKEIAQTFDFIKFNKKLLYDVKGHFDFDSPETSDINAGVTAGEVDLKGYVLNNASGQVTFDNNKLLVSDIKAQFGGGRASGLYEYDLSSDKSAVHVNAENFDISHLPTVGDKGTGKADVELDVGMQFFKDKPVQVSGEGKGQIKEAKLWKIPILTSLANTVGKILPTKGLGEITELYTELELKGTELKIKRIRTNGNIIAFNGKGTIQLDEEYVDVMLETKPLPNVLWSLIPKLLRPITKTLQINLKGKYDNLDWTPAQGLWERKK